MATNVYVVENEGDPGDFHCMDCLRIGNYITESYCCDKIRNMPMKQKKCESYFLRVCFYRNSLNKIAAAMEEGKKVVDEKGKCIFCRNTKQHEEQKWCANKTPLQLFNHIIGPKEREIETFLDKYIEVRVNNRLSDMKHAQDRVERVMLYSLTHHQERTPDEIRVAMLRTRREARRVFAREVEIMERESREIRERHLETVRQRRAEIIESLEKAEIRKKLEKDQERLVARYTAMNPNLL